MVGLCDLVQDFVVRTGTLQGRWQGSKGEGDRFMPDLRAGPGDSGLDYYYYCISFGAELIFTSFAHHRLSLEHPLPQLGKLKVSFHASAVVAEANSCSCGVCVTALS